MTIQPHAMRLYAVTHRAWAGDDQTLLAQISAAIRGGAGIVQLREKHLPPAAFLPLARDFVALCRAEGAVSIINAQVDIALQAGADGVHVGQSDLEAATVRQRLGPDKLLGVSVHNVEEALRAQSAGADYLGVGAAFFTGTKQDAVPVTRATMRAITQAVTIPVVAIGGVNEDNLLSLSGCGLDGVAVVSALFGAPDVACAAQRLLALSTQMVQAR